MSRAYLPARALKLEEMTLQLVRFDQIPRLPGVNILAGAPTLGTALVTTAIAGRPVRDHGGSL